MKRIGFVCLLLVLALATMGAAFAHWTQTLYIDGVVHTGTYCLGFEEVRSDDPAVSECVPGDIDDDERLDPPDYEKNVAGCWGELLIDKGDHEDNDIYEKLRIVVCNAYPSYENTMYFTIANGGSIPGDVVGATLVKVGDTAVDTELPKCTIVDVDLNGDGEFDVNLHFDGPADEQVDPCDALQYSLWMHFKDGVDAQGNPTGLPQDSTLTFEIEIETVQWNLAP